MSTTMGQLRTLVLVLSVTSTLLLAPPSAEADSSHLVSLPNGKEPDNGVLSANGTFVAYNAGRSVYLVDVLRHRTRLVTKSADGVRPAISATGRFVAFVERGVLRRWDRRTGSDMAVGAVPLDNFAMSASGRYFTFYTIRSGHDRVVRVDARTRSRTVVASAPTDSLSQFGVVGISADGESVAYWTVGDSPSGEVPGPTNPQRPCDLHVWRFGNVVTLPTGPYGIGICGDENPTLSTSGRGAAGW